MFDKRIKALSLRREGWSIKAIAEDLGVAKSTSSIWCQEIQLTKRQQNALNQKMINAGHKGRLLGALMNKTKKEMKIRHYQEEGKALLACLSEREFLISGLALYWAEGTKKRGKLAFTNSDPAMIKFVKLWLENVLGVPTGDFRPRIFINAIHEARLQKIISYWSLTTGLPEVQFAKPVLLQRPPRKTYENYDNYYGVLSFEVRKGTDLKYKVLGLIDALKVAQIPSQTVD